MKKRTLIIPLILLALIAGVAVYLFSLLKPVSVSGEELEDVRIEVPKGKSIRTIGDELEEKGVIRSSKAFYFIVRFPNISKIIYKSDKASTFVLKSGIYFLNPSMNYVQILEELSSGKQEYVKVSIPEGLTISKVAELLSESNIVSKDDFISAAKDEAFVRSLGIDSSTAEGYLFPDTYYLTPDISSGEVIKIMVENFFEKIKSISNLSEKSSAEINEIVKLASIVEREYRVTEEAPLIASVFKNRLRYNIGLYSCATVEYIVTEIQGLPHPERILYEHTHIDNPYNTYIYAGLPPTAISNPGLVSLEASTNTPKTDYYFFQVNNPEKGTHVFTKTLEEHNENH